MIDARRTLLALLLAAACSPASAADGVTVEVLGCKQGVHLVARNAKASVVLVELSKQLGFDLKFESQQDRTLDVDMTKRGPQLVAKLMQSDNVIYDEVPDPKCPGRQKLAKVWVLPSGEEGPPPPRAMTPMEMYRKAHGLPPEEEKDKPATKDDEAR